MTTYTGDLSVYLGSGNIASRPATPSIDPTMTALWFSDDTGELSAYTVASGWTTISGGGGGGSSQLPLTRAFVPELSTWTQLNATGASFAEKTAVGGLTKALQLTSVTGSGVSAPNFQGLYRAAPSPPYRLVCGFYPTGAYAQYPSFQFGFYDGTKLLTIALDQSTNGDGSRVTVVAANGVTTPGSEPFSSTNGPMSYRNSPAMFAWESDGTTLKAQWTGDGVAFSTFWSQNISGGHLANQNNFCAVVNTYDCNGKKAIATMFEWDEDGLNRTLNNVYFG